MKTWEMVKALTENPKKKFKTIGNEYLIAWVGFSTGSIKFENTSQGCKFNPSTEWEWEETKESVTWQEAIQAWIGGKRFTIEYQGNVYTQLKMNKLGCFGIDRSSGFEEGMFIRGKWYIED